MTPEERFQTLMVVVGASIAFFGVTILAKLAAAGAQFVMENW